MYLTKNDRRGFDWEKFFSGGAKKNEVQPVESLKIVSNIRSYMKESRFRLTFTLIRMIRNLYDSGLCPEEPKVIELGAATGLLTRLLINQYGGGGVLVDNNETSFQAYQKKVSDKRSVTYVKSDIFSLNTDEKYDITCSFGLIEHFENKGPVLNVHKSLLKDGGHCVIIVPMDSLLSRVFYEVHPELNLGYRELVTPAEFKTILESNGLNVIKMVSSVGYSYDYVGAVCKTV